MLLTYQECLDRYGSDYQLKKEIRNGNLFRKEKGIYSTARNTSEVDEEISESGMHGQKRFLLSFPDRRNT